MPPAFVYLASQSPRRSQLLDQLGLAHQLLLAGPEEDAEALEQTVAGEAPHAYVQRVSASASSSGPASSNWWARPS